MKEVFDEIMKDPWVKWWLGFGVVVSVLIIIAGQFIQ